MRILLKVVDPRRIKGGRAPDDPMDLVTLLEQQVCQVAAVLSGDPRNERFLHVPGVEKQELPPGGRKKPTEITDSVWRRASIPGPARKARSRQIPRSCMETGIFKADSKIRAKAHSIPASPNVSAPYAGHANAISSSTARKSRLQ